MTDISPSSPTKVDYIKSVRYTCSWSLRCCIAFEPQLHPGPTILPIADRNVHHRVCLQSNHRCEYNIGWSERKGLCCGHLTEEGSCEFPFCRNKGSSAAYVMCLNRINSLILRLSHTST